MDDQAQPTQPVETEEQKVERATKCLKEIDTILAKYDCMLKINYTVSTDGTSKFDVMTVTK